MDLLSQISLSHVLDRSADDLSIDDAPHLHGFGGLHGGLLMARMVAVARAQAPGGRPRAVTAHFHRPARGRLDLRPTPVRSGRTVTAVDVQAVGEHGVVAGAVVLLAAERAERRNPVPLAPPAPIAPDPQTLEPFRIPPEFVPIAAQTEIRPVGPNRPFAGGRDPELVAWIRIVDDDDAPDATRLAFLLDALAPAHAAVLTDLAAMPTVQITAHLGAEPAATDSAWVLVRAISARAGADGWLQEDLDVWSSSGIHLASARQVRLLA